MDGGDLMMDCRNALTTTIESLRIRRYPTLIVLESSGRELSCPYAEVAAVCDLSIVDYREDVLAKDAGIVLGAYTWGEFLRWLKGTASRASGVLVMNADDLISTWTPVERRAFWREFSRTECSATGDNTRKLPIVLVSHLAREYAPPSDKTGQGIVADIEDMIGESNRP
jgi:hypothetical protein